jgi:hypothetical protein
MLTFKCAFNFKMFRLKSRKIVALIALRPGISTPSVARDAISIISLKWGLVVAPIGCQAVERDGQKSREINLPDLSQLST